MRVRHRGLYCLKDTFVTHTLRAADEQPLQRDKLIAFVVRQTGVRESTLRRHYEKQWPRDREHVRETYAVLDPSVEIDPGRGSIRAWRAGLGTFAGQNPPEINRRARENVHRWYEEFKKRPSASA